MKRAASKPTHVTYGNVLDDLGFSPERATALKFKAELYQAILKCAQKYSQRELQLILGEPQPRVSELLNGKISKKSVDKLLHYAGRMGLEAKVRFTAVRIPRQGPLWTLEEPNRSRIRRGLTWAAQARPEETDIRSMLNRGSKLTAHKKPGRWQASRFRSKMLD